MLYLITVRESLRGCFFVNCHVKSYNTHYYSQDLHGLSEVSL